MKKKTWLIIGAVVIVLAIVIIALTKPSTSTTNYAVETVTKGDISLLVSASGNVTPENVYNVNPRINAKVLEVNVKSGDKVTKDQQLAKLDDTDLQAAVKSAQYSLNSAIYARNKLQALPIVDDNSVKQAQQQINTASIQVETAKRNLNNAKILSPIDGEVLTSTIKVGDYANGSSSAFIVGSSGQFFAFLNVNEIDINSVSVGQAVDVQIDALAKKINGTIVQVENYGVNLTGIVYYKIKVSLDDQVGLKTNMTVNADIAVEKKTGILTIPAGALTIRNGKNYVKTAVYDSKGVLAPVEKEVQVGINNNSIVEITSGLNEGDKIVIVSTSKNAISFNLGGN